ncbi:recombination-associated protein RdgC [Chitinibacter bivalviorum]|uniref:Recombination-associated protein RdgC n=1 Tax=Chitinibacter bivalviorum TaxID=2739434 RepID=A0A7H9BGJ2_9NEIS|nr:recombination-associated protein RdgC [Chitinibacter bivalviorum]QLG87843.1 recombination-associated protein RdgC [Chitinibacter bivalviorum]
MLWFRNLQIYRLSADHALSPDSIATELAKRPFIPCGSMDMESCGWVAPARHEPAMMALERQNAVLVALKSEEKVLPAAVVKDELDYRVQQIEAAESRKVGRKEQREMKDRIIEELTPRAFTRSRVQRALLDLESGLVLVDAASAAKAEYLLSTLRETLGSLPTRLIDTEISPSAAMTEWLSNETPDAFALGQDAELKVPGDEGSIARFKRQVMDCDEVRQHLAVGKIVTRLSLAFGERLTFTLTDALEIKSLAMLDVLKDELKDMDAETQDALFESQFALLIGELRGFIPELLNALGGETER